MRIRRHVYSALVIGATTVAGACGKGHDARTSTAGGDVAIPSATSAAPATTTASVDSTRHHSKLAGAAGGAVVGHMLGGHAVAGAAAGALIQHERNKHHR